ncbi:MAG TPA: PaaI family thioesterase [Tepidiformaceae bacterium]|nr:PaaI family thioesterase [Tepidiformaceae bacterium]
MNDDILAGLRELYAGRYWGLVGIETISAERGRVVNRVVLREDHLNYNHVVHGGVISSLIDSAAGGAVRSTRAPEEIRARPHATSDLHVTYLSPASAGELIARARVVKAGRTAIFTEVDVETGEGKLVARGLVTFVIGAGPPVAQGE